MSLEEHLSLYGGVGTYESSGCFTLDREKALQKLAEFSLEHWLDIIFILAAWLDHDHQSSVEFLLEPRRLLIRRERTSLTVEELEHLEVYLLAGGAHQGLSFLSLAQHLWTAKGSLAIETQGVKRLWRKGKAHTEVCHTQDGLQLDLSCRDIEADSEHVASFFSKHLRWTSFDWTLNGLPVARSASTPGTLMILNTPPGKVSLQSGVVVSQPDWDFQMIAQWDPHGTTSVVVDGLAYPLPEPLLQGFEIVVFGRQVQRNLTWTQVSVAQGQRELWTEALDLLIEGFLKGSYCWKSDDFLTRHSAALCRAVWSRLDRVAFLAVAERLVVALPEKLECRLLRARLLVRERDFRSALALLSQLAQTPFSDDDLSYLSQLEDEFVDLVPGLAIGLEDLERLVLEFSAQVEHLRRFPRIVQAFFLALAKRSEVLGNLALSEQLYLDSYLRPRGRKSKVATFLNIESLTDKTNSGLPAWIEEADSQPDYLEGLLHIVALAQARQSPQGRALDFLSSEFRDDVPEEILAQWNLRRLEAWRLERRHSQREWYKWLLMSRRKGWRPTFPPLSHDRTYDLPPYQIGSSPEARLGELRSRTVYLEFANLAWQFAKRTEQWEQVARFERIKMEMMEVFQAYEAPEEMEHLWELARIAIELGERDKASDYLQRAICRVPPGDFSRLPLLVDLAILEPHRAASVINGLVRVLNVEEQSVGTTLERRIEQCLWPFPLELPSRLRRLAWELDRGAELRVYRIAQVLFGKVLGTKWSDTSEGDWVKDAIGLLTSSLRAS